MRFLFFILYIFSSLIIYGQTPRSEFIKYVSHNKIDGDKLTRMDTVVLQINERQGDGDAKIYIDYTKGDKLSIGEAWIEDMNGNIVRKLKSKEIEDHSYISNISIYEDDFLKTFELKYNIYPYRIVYSYKKVFSRYLSAVNINYAESRIPVRSGIVIVETNPNQPVKYRQRNVEEPEVNEDAKSIKYEWKYSYNPSNEREKHASIKSLKAPFIQVLPINFKYGVKGSYENWQTFGDWVFQLNKKRDELTESEKQKISLLLTGVNDDLEKAKILYQYLQDYTRYINVSVNVGGFQAYPASYVCQNKYGDCKALTNYMQAMLKYVGIKSYYTLVRAGNRIWDIDMDFPEQVFNHVILTVPINQDTTYLECTSKSTPFGYVSTFIQGRKALLIDEGNSVFVDIPKQLPEDVLCTRNIKVDINSAKVEIAGMNRGSNYEYFTYLMTEANKNILERYIRDNILSGSYDLINYKVGEFDRNETQMTLNAECQVHNLFKAYGKNLILTPIPINVSFYESPEKRTQDVKIDFPEYYSDTIVYDISGYTISKIPENIHLESDYGNYTLTFEIEKDKLIIYKSVLIHAGEYTLSDYKSFYQFMVSVRNYENNNYYLDIL